MSTSTILVLSSSFIILIISFLLFIFTGNAVRVRFQYSMDVPRQMSIPITKFHNTTYLESAGYSHVATLYPFGAFGFWQGDCFKDNSGYLTFTQDSGLGYIIITVKEVSNGKSWTCLDYYQFVVVDQTIATDSIYFSTFPHETVFDSQDKDLKRRIRENGVYVYVYKSDQLNILKDLKETFSDRSQPSRVTGINIDVHHRDVGDSVTARAEEENVVA